FILQGWINFHVAVLFFKYQLAGGINGNWLRDPSATFYLTIIFEADVFGRGRILFFGLQQSNEIKAFLVDPELRGFEISLFCAADQSWASLPLRFMHCREVDVQILALLNSFGNRLGVDVEAENEKRMDPWLVARQFPVFVDILMIVGK